MVQKIKNNKQKMKKIKESTEAMKDLKGHLSFLSKSDFLCFKIEVGFCEHLRALSFLQNWPARLVCLQGKCNNLKEHLHDNPSYCSGGVYIILEVC